MSFVTLWLDRSGGDVEADLAFYQPEGIIVGLGAWEDIPRLVEVCPSLNLITLRDTRKPLLEKTPEDVGGLQCDVADRLIACHPVLRGRLWIHGLDEEQTNRALRRSGAWMSVSSTTPNQLAEASATA